MFYLQSLVLPRTRKYFDIKQTLKKTEATIKNRQSTDTGNIDNLHTQATLTIYRNRQH
jgi:NAD-dependent SIR2 family protein deacetylase